MEPDDIRLEAYSTFLPPEKKEVKPYRVKNVGVGWGGGEQDLS